MPKSIYLLAACFLLSIPLAAQTTWSAEGPGISVWVGASISTFNPDYGCGNNSPVACWQHQLLGISPYAHTNAFLFNRIGAEGQLRFLHWRGPDHLTEASYMAGPRVSIYHHRKFAFGAKFLIGPAHIDVVHVVKGTYLAYAPGASLDYRVAKRVYVRADYEYQLWPGFKGIQTGPGHGGLTPNGFSLGVSYARVK